MDRGLKDGALLADLAFNPFLFIFISLTLNMLIAISGLLPSAFLTAANISFFGFGRGLLLSLLGEVLGAILSFILYRNGLTKLPLHKKPNRIDKFLNRLKATEGIEAVYLVLILRILPFIPSGLVTLAAAYSKMGVLAFGLASTVGKIPALFIEAYSVDRALNLSTKWQVGIIIIALIIYLFYFFWKKGSSTD